MTIFEFSPDGKTIAVGYSDGTVKLFDYISEPPKCVFVFKNYHLKIGELLFSNNGRYLLTETFPDYGRNTRIYRIWEGLSGKCIYSYTEDKNKALIKWKELQIKKEKKNHVIN